MAARSHEMHREMSMERHAIRSKVDFAFGSKVCWLETKCDDGKCAPKKLRHEKDNEVPPVLGPIPCSQSNYNFTKVQIMLDAE